jgi:hypothetical protein
VISRLCVLEVFRLTNNASYHILGSTLSSKSIAAGIAQHIVNLLPVLERTEGTCYLCCPPLILRAILSCSQLCNSIETASGEPPPSATDEAFSLLHQVSSFDVKAWAAGVQRLSTISDLRSRERVASAHQSAACLYILEAIPSVRTLSRLSMEDLIADIHIHLGHIDENDVHFKATSWPTFIAGVEARDSERRAWTLKRLLAVWSSCPWGYIVMATDTLKKTWRLQDESPREHVSWLRELRARNSDCLVV